MFIEVTKRNQIQSYDLKHERDMIYVYTYIVVSLSTWCYLIIHITSLFYIYKENKENICNIVRLTEWNYLETKPLNILPVQIERERQSFNDRDREKANFVLLSITALSNKNRLNDDRTEKEEKKTIEGNTFERGHNTEQQYKIERVKEATKGLQMIINIRQTEMLFNIKVEYLLCLVYICSWSISFF
jgi:hypothetical protein